MEIVKIKDGYQFHPKNAEEHMVILDFIVRFKEKLRTMKYEE